MASQGENCLWKYLRDSTQIDDLRWKCCILRENSKNNISGRKHQLTRHCLNDQIVIFTALSGAKLSEEYQQ
jgi:hypothetical protein